MVKIETLPAKLMKKGLREKMAKICEGNDISFVAIFGSFVRREENRRSDIDIAIEFTNKSRKNLFDLIRIEEELKKVFGRKVDLGIFSAINPRIVEDIKMRCWSSMKKDKAYLKDILDAISDINKIPELKNQLSKISGE